MNTYLKHLFNLQTDILLNHTLIALIKFFLNPTETRAYLYHTIINTNESSKTELAKMSKKVPKTLKYEVYAQKNDNKLSIILHTDSLTDIEIYNMILVTNRPSINTLKNITRIIVSKCRPMPTKVDSEFSIISKRYDEYLKCYQIKRNWQNGHITNYLRRHNTPKDLVKIINKDYEKILLDVTRLKDVYRAFTKVLIDIYLNKKEKSYSTHNNTYLMEVIYLKDYSISISIDNNIDQRICHEIIPLNDFHPAASFFVKKYQMYEDITRCVCSSLIKYS